MSEATATTKTTTPPGDLSESSWEAETYKEARKAETPSATADTADNNADDNDSGDADSPAAAPPAKASAPRGATASAEDAVKAAAKAAAAVVDGANSSDRPSGLSPAAAAAVGGGRRRSVFGHDSVDNLVFWKDRVRTGIAVSIGFLIAILILFLDYTLLTVTSWAACIGLTGMILYRNGHQAYVALRGGKAVDPYADNWPLSRFRLHKESIHQTVDWTIDCVNGNIDRVRAIVYCENTLDTVKVCVAVYVVGWLGRFMSFTTFFFLVYFGMFTVPMVYKLYQPQIDSTVGKVVGKVFTVSQKALDALPRHPKTPNIARKKAD